MVNLQAATPEEALSAVMDGSASPEDWARAEAAWQADPGLRSRWAAWHAVGDGLRAPDLLPLHRDPELLLKALRQAPASGAAPLPRSGWWAPLAVAASFVIAALGLGAWQPTPDSSLPVAAAPISTAPPQGLVGLSFAQAAASPRLAVDTSAAELPPAPTLGWPQLAASATVP